MINLNIISKKIKKHTIKFRLLLILVLITTVITYYRIKIQMNLGPIWDTYDFLSNALLFAGQGTGYSNLTHPPLLSFLTSVFFSLGYVSESVIFVIDGLLFIFGIIGLYLLFNLRFKPSISFLGSLLFATFPIVLQWIGTGYSDISSLSFSIWTIYFAVLAVKKNPKYFYLVFPFLIIASATRYLEILIIIPIVLYLIINRSHIKNLKDILIGISISILILIPFIITFYSILSEFFSAIFSFSSLQQPVPIEHFAYNPSPLYYVYNMINYIGPAGVAILLIILLCSFIYLIKDSNNLKFNIKKLNNYFKIEKTVTKIKLALFIVLVVFFLSTFGKASIAISEIAFLLIIYTIYGLLKGLKENIDMDLLFLSWFMVFFIFHSLLTIKVDRYFILMAPALIYFLILGFSGITNNIYLKFRNINVIPLFLSSILIIIMLISAFSFLGSIPQEDQHTNDVISSSNWLKDHDPAYKTKVIYADFYWPYFSWYLKMKVNPMPIFKDGNVYYYELKGYIPNLHDNMRYNNELKTNNVDYYFCTRKGLNLESYNAIKQFGTIIVYKKR